MSKNFGTTYFRANLASLQKKQPILLQGSPFSGIYPVISRFWTILAEKVPDSSARIGGRQQGVAVRITRYVYVSRYELIVSELMKCPAFRAMQDKSLTD